MASPRATVGIISIGEMGCGIASLLISQNYRVITNLTNRSPSTHARAQSANIEIVPNDTALVNEADYILSIVPPRDALATAYRIRSEYSKQTGSSNDTSNTFRSTKQHPLWYLELNAISPTVARDISTLFADLPQITFLDGGVIGGPPTAPPTSSSDATSWVRPGIPLSGPLLSSAPISGEHLAATLNTRHLDSKIGTASALKCSFAALSKGFTALALQSFSTAEAVGVLPALRDYLDVYSRGSTRERAERGITGCARKADRWIHEMIWIGECFAEEGGWGPDSNIFKGVAGVYTDLALVVEERGGTQGMMDRNDVEGAVRILRKELKDGILSKEALDKMLEEQ